MFWVHGERYPWHSLSQVRRGAQLRAVQKTGSREGFLKGVPEWAGLEGRLWTFTQGSVTAPVQPPS